jgi:hypothetical protein
LVDIFVAQIGYGSFFLLLNKSPFYLCMMFILTSLVVSRRVKRNVEFARQKVGTEVKRTMSKSTARRVAET